MKRFAWVFLALGGLVLFSPIICLAEDVDLDKIVVTPSRFEESYGSTAQTVDVFTAKDIEEGQYNDVADLITQATSVNISSNGGLGQSKNLRMRGSTSAQVLVMVDGRPINNPRDGTADLSAIPLDNIARVELVHGPGSSVYGSQAMGGTLNIITKPIPKDKAVTQLYSSIGSFQTYTERFSHGNRVSNFGYLISGTYQSSGGFRTNTEYNEKDFNTKFEYKLNSKNDLVLNAGFFKSRAGAPGPVTIPDIDDKQVNLKNYLDLVWNFKPDETSLIKFRSYNNYDRLEFNENSMDSIFDTGVGKFIHTTQARGFDVQANKKFFDVYQAVLGLSYIGNFNDSTSTAKHKYNVKAAFLENQLELFNRLKLSLNVRVDDYSNFGTQASPSFSVVYDLNDKAKLHGSVSRSFRAPTFNDLYWLDSFAVGNPNLRPEKGLTEEIGIEAKIGGKASVGLNYYHSKFEELIQWSPMTDDPWGIWTVKNIGSAVIDGVELTNKINLTDNFETNIGYSFLIARDDKTHKYLVYQPKNKVDLALKYKGFNGLTFEVNGQYTGMRFGNDSNTVKVNRFFVINISASKKFKCGLTYLLAVDNLLNDKYQVISGYPVPGLSVTNGVKFEF